MSLYTQCLGYVAPFYNIALVIIVLIMFVKLFLTPNKKIFTEPWKWLFFAVLIYVLEEIITVLDASGVSVSLLVYPILETAIITCFIYMLLIQKQYVESGAQKGLGKPLKAHTKNPKRSLKR